MVNVLALCRQIENELTQDRAWDDVTTGLLGPHSKAEREAVIRAKQGGIFCASAVCEAFARWGVDINALVPDGAVIGAGDAVVRVRGSVGQCLAIERTLLNLLSHLCGIATTTRRYVDAAKPHKAKILATRKTLLGMRELQCAAVQAGGGRVHRRSLSDGILIKDNHIGLSAGPELVRQARAQRSPLHRIEIEVQDLRQLRSVLENPPDVVMLDNFNRDEWVQAMSEINGRCEVEVSGGVKLDDIGFVASLGVDYISVGALTHSVTALDLSMDWAPGAAVE